MNPATVICVTLALIASVQGGSQRFVRRAGTNIAAAGASEAYGAGAGVAEQGSAISVHGWGPDNPAQVSLGMGSNVGLDQYGSSYQQTQINADGSSAAYQGNYAGNSGYANEYLSGYASGDQVDVVNAGWTALEGEGSAAQIDELSHSSDGVPAGSSGWRKP